MISLKYFYLRDPTKVIFYNHPRLKAFDHCIEIRSDSSRDDLKERIKQMDAWCRMAIGPRGERSTRHWNRDGHMILFRRPADAFAFKVRWSGI